MSPNRRTDATAPGALLLLLAGCDAPMSIFRTASPEADRLAHIGWILIIAAVAVYIPVMAIMLYAAYRRRSTSPDVVEVSHRLPTFPLVGGALIPTIILIAVFLLSLVSERNYEQGESSVPIRFQVVGKQWWWDVQYLDPTLSGQVRLANEIHVPVGRPVQLTLISADVIHSFWIPQLNGKIDLIPGDTNTIRITATKPGVYRGQCAEYCGLQHAHMAFTVIADSLPAWKRWIASQQADAIPPADSFATMGQTVVAGAACSLCHTIRGTPVQGKVGPDLTHVGSRLTLAAGTVPNNLATMEAWITHAQSLKPGTLMPSLPQFSGVQLRAMAAYLEALR